MRNHAQALLRELADAVAGVVRPLIHRSESLMRSRGAKSTAEAAWFDDHYSWAPGQIDEFIRGAGLTLKGLRIADIGSGDGIMALGVTRQLQPRELIGYDVRLTNTDELLARARRAGVCDSLPAELHFERCEPHRLPATSSSFDAVYTWSVFEHVTNPSAVLAEIRRVLKPEGFLFLQLWPFYFSERGSHLWDWFSEPFHHLVQSEEEIVGKVRARPTELAEYMIDEYRMLNQVTVDDLGHSLVESGFDVRRLELLSNTVNVPPGLGRRHLLSNLGVAGVKLLAFPTG
jgi:ubiquinone/menaquinone biosynthesis C-methylase UbiE